MDQKNGGSISFGDNSFTTKQCTGYVPHKPSWYDVEHVGKMLDYDPNISDTNNNITSRNIMQSNLQTRWFIASSDICIN